MNFTAKCSLKKINNENRKDFRKNNKIKSIKYNMDY